MIEIPNPDLNIDPTFIILMWFLFIAGNLIWLLKKLDDKANG